MLSKLAWNLLYKLMAILFPSARVVGMSLALKNNVLKDTVTGIWRDGSAVGHVGCSSSGPGFQYQDPHGSSQLFIIPVLGDLTPSHKHTTCVAEYQCT